MALFPPEEGPVFDIDIVAAKRLNEIFQQKPARIPLELPLQPTSPSQPPLANLPYSPTFIIKEEQNILPIVAVVGILTFFGFLAFAFMTQKKG
jgi:hypothetical protein